MKIKNLRRTFVFLSILFIFVLAFFALKLFVDFIFNRDSIELTYPSSNVEYTKWQLPDGAKTRLGKGVINEIKFSPDGTQFAVATTLGVWIYDAKTGNEISLLDGDRQNILDIAYSSDGHRIIGANSAGRLPQWNVTTGALESVFMKDDIKSFKSVFFSDDSSYLISVNVSQNKINVFNFDDVHTPLQISNIDFDFKDAHNPVIALSQDKHLLAIAVSEQGHNSPIHVWDMLSGKYKFTQIGHTRWIKSLAFSPDGKTLASGDQYRTIKLWDMDAQVIRSTYRAPVSFSSLAFLPNGKLLASGSHDGSVYLWNPTKEQKGLLGKVAQYFPKLRLKKHNYEVTALAFSPDGNMLITGSKDGTIRSWNTSTGKHLYLSTGHTVEITGFTTTPNEDKMFVIHTWDYQLVHWDMKLSEQVSSTFFNDKSPIAISPDAKTLVLKDWNANDPYKLWDIPNKRLQGTITGIELPLYILIFIK